MAECTVRTSTPPIVKRIRLDGKQQISVGKHSKAMLLPQTVDVEIAGEQVKTYILELSEKEARFLRELAGKEIGGLRAQLTGIYHALYPHFRASGTFKVNGRNSWRVESET